VDNTEQSHLIDAHQHFWHYDPDEYGWIDDSMASLRRDFLPSDLYPEINQSGVSGTVAVQARQTIAETEWLLELATENSFLRGVVGWAPIAEASFPKLLEKLTENPKLVGLRHVVQAEPDGFLAASPFNEGINALAETGLVYDILIVERQLPEAIAFVDRHPNQIFVLDHIAKPCIAEAQLEPWARNLTQLARRENVYCKLSGMVTEASWHRWTITSLQAYVDVALEAFTPKRLMFGSDWPVCTVAATYNQWITTVGDLLASLSGEERERVFSGTAVEAYRLK
jgi:L-fuconolactonase